VDDFWQISGKVGGKTGDIHRLSRRERKTKTLVEEGFSSLALLVIPTLRSLPKLDVAGSTPVARSTLSPTRRSTSAQLASRMPISRKSWSGFWSGSQLVFRRIGGCSLMNDYSPDRAPGARTAGAHGWTFVAFRAWREHEHPRSGYQIAPKVWRPESLAVVVGETDARRRAMKNWEPRIFFRGYAET
jgi:hypothetical protein